jgi:hypothetical protein
MIDWSKPLKLTDGREVDLHDYVPNKHPSWLNTDFTRCVIKKDYCTYILYAREDGSTEQPNFEVVNR